MTTTSEYVARFLGVDTGALSVGASVGTIVGGDDALDTHDGDTSYVLLAKTGFLYLGGPQEFTEMPFRWERVSGPPQSAGTATSITVEGAMRRDDTATPVTAYGPVFSVPSQGSNLWTWLIPADEPDGYVERTTLLSPSFANWFSGDYVWRMASAEPDIQFRAAFRVTYLRVVMEGGVPPLRQRNRDDNRARLKPSRQLSIRARGYL